MTTTEEEILELKKLLITKNGSSWIDFMDHIYDKFSDILKKGKPKYSAISSSIIGRSGFNSWREMIETKENKGGLGWKYSSFDSWKRAYSIVKKHPYLREKNISASQINSMSRKTKNKIGFPSTQEMFNKELSEQKNIKRNYPKEAIDEINALKDKIKALEKLIPTTGGVVIEKHFEINISPEILKMEKPDWL
ncbi:hypothetical protein [Psychromonas antarctica]|uniref:hypothetical protein n=1 Tax=Psychromonas antarctica TaxID=67573 RepID=UPI001EE80B14|nr:hypothetical protein [Psychromonas antarctica]MCG6202040.1 hypothetical protein [Psychromonas antarctica]